jgi:hypothetical protein
MVRAVKAVVFLIFLGFVGCSTEPSPDQLSCQNSDWYEIGRRDGASGAPLDRLKGYRRDCGAQWTEQTENIYRNGRNAGLVEYCTDRNGFELGRMRLTYNDVCPSTVEDEFLQSYKKGEKARSLETENQRLTDRIEQLARQLSDQSDLTDGERHDISNEMEGLKKSLTQSEQQLNQISR